MGTGKHILEYVYDNEQRYSGKTWFTQPVSGGNVTTYSWSDAMQQARAMAAHLQSLGYEPGSKIAMVSKNCAHFMMAELAIWMAGHGCALSDGQCGDSEVRTFSFGCEITLRR